MRRHIVNGLQVVCLGALLALCTLCAGGARAQDAAPAGNPAAAASDDTCRRASFKLLIDVGHTPEDPGAISAHGNPEYGYNLALANAAMAQLVETGFRQTTLLLAKGKGYAQLANRAEIANRIAPNLLLSIHHDSSRERYIRKWEFAGVERNYSDKFSGHSLFVSARNPFVRQSTDFAKLLGRELASQGLQFTPQHAEDIPTARLPLIDAELGVYRYDNLVVLKDIRAPAVLFEAGLIINRKEELVLATAERRTLLAKAIASAMTEYCKIHPPSAVARARHPRPSIARSHGKPNG